MILLWLILILLLGGLLAWSLERRIPNASRYVSLIALGLDAVLVTQLWGKLNGPLVAPGAMPGIWIEQIRLPWIPRFGISLHLAIDGVSLLLATLTILLGILSVGASWTEIKQRTGFFHFNLLWVLAGILGVFLALDLFLFYFFWEMMLIPMYLLIIIWGHENRVYAGFKFFLFTQAGGLLMLLSILGLYFLHGQSTGVYTFDYLDLLGTPLASQTATWLMLGFFIAFAVKLPMVPFHPWLPAAHTEAPTAGSVILAGLLLKTGGYGILRFVLPLFPDASRAFAPVAMTLAAVGILYGAILAFAQTDLKKLVAYSSVSHLGFVLLGLFAGNELALQGAVLQMICHGVSTGALFILVGGLYERIHTRDMERMGGLWQAAPKMSAVTLYFTMASLGLPGLGNFVGEFLVLLGAYQVSVGITVAATIGLIGATIYSLRMMLRAFHGANSYDLPFADLNRREWVILGVLMIAILWLGVYPQPVIDTAAPVIERLTAAG
ncbi:MAG: NADH-quinone oxidoreductase subunit M [Bryobacterales bacterium]